MPVIEAGSNYLHEEGVFIPAIIHSIEQVPSVRPDWGDQLKFVLAVEGDDPENEVWAFTSLTYTSESKLGGFVLDILGEMPEPLDTDDLLDRPVEVKFERYTRTNPKSGLPQTKEKVVAIRSLTAV